MANRPGNFRIGRAGDSYESPDHIGLHTYPRHSPQGSERFTHRPYGALHARNPSLSPKLLQD